MQISKRALDVVQNLYVMQVELERFLESDLKDPDTRKQAKKRIKEFDSLLKEADASYMGGEDVYETLQRIRDGVSSKIKRSSYNRSHTSSPSSQMKKPVAKKSAAKKSATKKRAATSSAVKKAAKKTPAKKAASKKSVAKKPSKKAATKKKPSAKKAVKKTAAKKTTAKKKAPVKKVANKKKK